MNIKLGSLATLMTLLSLAAAQAIQLKPQILQTEAIQLKPDALQNQAPIPSFLPINNNIAIKPTLDLNDLIRKSDYTNFISAQNAIETKTWIARLATEINYKSEAFLQSLIGAQIDLNDPNIATSAPAARLLASYPLSYDLRSAKPGCWSIGYIRNQGQCGSCWAVAGATALSDRYCYKKLFPWFIPTIQMKRSFSYQDPLECCSAATCGTGHKKGCNGGYISGAYKFAKDTGIVTGENYGNTTNCKNYFLSPYSGTATAPACRLYCTTAGYGTTYNNDRYKISNYKVYASSNIGTSGVIAGIMDSIYNRGTVTAFLEVYNDFYTYSQGVYVKSANAVYKGGHAVRLIGWGYSSSINVGPFKIALGAYWIGANSWGTSWGINGFFHIRRGTNECKIESYVVEGFL